MYHVWPVLPAFPSELFDPYSPGVMEPSMVGVFHCAHTGAAARNTIMRTRASRNAVRRIYTPRIVLRLNNWKLLGISRFNSQRAHSIYPSWDPTPVFAASLMRRNVHTSSLVGFSRLSVNRTWRPVPLNADRSPCHRRWSYRV